jgi:hypothetical protein
VSIGSSLQIISFRKSCNRRDVATWSICRREKFCRIVRRFGHELLTWIINFKIQFMFLSFPCTDNISNDRQLGTNDEHDGCHRPVPGGQVRACRFLNSVRTSRINRLYLHAVSALASGGLLIWTMPVNYRTCYLAGWRDRRNVCSSPCLAASLRPCPSWCPLPSRPPPQSSDSTGNKTTPTNGTFDWLSHLTNSLYINTKPKHQ